MAGAWQMVKQMLLPNLESRPDPFSLGHWGNGEPGLPPSPPPLPRAYSPDGATERVLPCLAQNIERLQNSFMTSRNHGLSMRWIDLDTNPPTRAVLLFMEGMVDAPRLQESVLDPLLHGVSGFQPTPAALSQAVAGAVVSLAGEWGQVVNGLLSGSAALLVDGADQALMAELTGWPKRSISTPRNEVTVMGPQEALTEDLRTNLTQIRRRLRTPDLVVSWGSIGRRSRSDVAVIHLDGVANPALVAEVHRRVAGLAHRIDYLADAGSLAQLISDRPYALYPSIVVTERPDRLAGQIAEGYVVVLVDSDAHGLILPATLNTFFHSPEDVYMRWPFAAFMRVTRLIAYFITLLLPALYISLANYRQEMIPTPLLMAVAGSRETVPFTTVMEVLMMETAFELIREAAIRVPTIIGPTIGIVGTLILGQTAVQAGIISPIMVIITSTTALTSFAIPQYELQYAARILRFAYIGAAAFLGLYGLLLLLLAHTAYLVSGNSFGVPFMAPIMPDRGGSEGLTGRSPLVQEEKRPATVQPLDQERADPVVRPWDPLTDDQEGGGGE